MLAQHQQQQYQQHLKSQQPYTQQLVQARSQEMLAQRTDDQIYYQNGYGGSPQRTGGRYIPVANRDNVNIQQLQVMSKNYSH